MTAHVHAVHSSPVHGFSKQTVPSIRLIEGLGVEGDAHAGTTVKHRSRVKKDASTPNLRQVHLIHDELFDALREIGHEVRPGDLGENVTTRGLDLLALPVGARLAIGEAVIVVTGLRNPCNQINDFQPGLMKQMLRKDDSGEIERLAGVMGIVVRTGHVAAGDPIDITWPPEPHHRLTVV